MSTSLDDYLAVRTNVAAMTVVRDAISVAGPDAETYLQGQLSQNIAVLAVGASTMSFILQPHGKVDALVRVTRLSSEAFVLDTDEGYGPAVVERLTRFKMRTKVEVAARELKMVALRGADATAVARGVQQIAGAEFATASHWKGIEGVDIFGSDLSIGSDIHSASASTYETLRIECGIPAMGSELDEKTIPAEAGVNDLAIDFRKGCYTGQELVARIDARGNNVPRHLVGVAFELEEVPPRGAQLIAAGRATNTKPWGLLTSTASSPGFRGAVALAYVRREVQAPADALLEWDNGPTPCRVLPLPMKPADE